MIPLNFALTYAMGKILSYYFYKKTQWLKATNSELKELFKYSVKSGKNIAKKEKDEIIKTWHQYKNIITEKITDISWKSESKVKNIINKIKKH
jgi:gas vesicle protein